MLLRGKTGEELAEELIPVSHNQFSTRKGTKILDAIKADGGTTRDYQSERDEVTRGLVEDDFGKMGTYDETPEFKVDWTLYAVHGAERMQQRGMTQEMVNNIVENGKVLS